jgi:O-antigen/teichoic acid export membrane protein
MANAQKLISNLSVAFLSQGVSFLLSVLTALLVPKVLGVEEFGYWQLLLFYGSYVGIFQFGLVDGIYLINGGLERSQIDKRAIGSQFWFGLAFQSVFAFVIALCALFGPFDVWREFVLIAVSLFLLLSNSALFLGFVFQAMNETKLFSFSVMVDRLVFLVPLGILLLTGCTDFRFYAISLLVARFGALAFCVVKAWDILRLGLFKPAQAVRECLASMRVGIKLMLSNITSTLVIGAARFAIDMVWGIETFGELSFSLSMVNFFLVFITQVSMVLFPFLRQSDKSERVRFFCAARDSLGLLLPAVYIFCYPMIWVLSLWLPQYTNSFIYFVYLLPLCVFDGKMNIVGTTYFKVLRKEKTLLAVNVMTAAFSIICACIGGWLIGSINFIVLSVVVAIIGRSLISEWILSGALRATRSGIMVGEVLVTAGFMLLSVLLNDILAFLAYAGLYAIYLFVFRDDAKTMLRRFGRAGKALRD